MVSEAPVRGHAKAGIAWMLASVFFLASLDAVAKTLIQDYPVGQVIWARYFFQTAFLILFFHRRTLSLLKTRNLRLQLIRSMLLLGVSATIIIGLKFMQMASVAALMALSPLLVTALSALVLHEFVGVRRWFSVFVGFIGAVVIIRPGSDLLEPMAFLVVAGAVCLALYQISTRFLRHADSADTTLFYSTLAGTIVAALALPLGWETPDARGLGLMAAIGLFGCAAHFSIIRSLSLASPALTAPFTYTEILWAAGYGFVLFSDVPDTWTVIGAGIIAASGLYVLRVKLA